MKKIGRQNLTKKILIICTLLFGSFCPDISPGQKLPEVFDPALPIKKCWSYQTKASDSIFASDNEKGFIFSINDGRLFALESRSGVKLWETEIGGRVISDFVNDEYQKSIYLLTKSFPILDENKREERDAGESKNPNRLTEVSVKLRSVAKTTGIIDWQTTISVSLSNEYKILTAASEDKILVADQSGVIAAFGKIDGKIHWKKKIDAEPSDIYFDSQSKNFVILSKNKIFLLSAKTENLVILHEAETFLVKAANFGQNIIIAGSRNGEIYAFDIFTRRRLWKFRAGAEISNISVAPAGILATSFDNFVYLITPRKGRLLWKTRLDGRLIIKPTVSKDSAVVMTLGNPKAVILNLSRGEPVNEIILDADNNFINRGVLSGRLLIIPTAQEIAAYTNADNTCAGE